MLTTELITGSCELMIIFNNLRPDNKPFGCLLSFTNLNSPTKRLKLETTSDPDSFPFPSIKISINFVQLILVSIEPSFKMSTIKETFVGCIKLDFASKLSFKLTRIPIASDPTACVVKGPNKEEIKLTPPLSTTDFLAESWLATTCLSSFRVLTLAWPLTFFNVSKSSNALPCTSSDLFFMAKYF
ncbi:hypothetical protein LguiA_004016 [Lonicera macranthoides]